MIAPATSITPEPRKLTMLTPDQTDLRVHCLNLAANGSSEHPSETVKRAQAYYDFVTGKSDQTPREAIDAALEAANVR